MVPYQMATLSIDRSVTKGHDVTMNEALTRALTVFWSHTTLGPNHSIL